MKHILIIGLSALLAGCGSFADPREWVRASDPSRAPDDLVDVVNQIKPDEVWSVDIGTGSSQYGKLRPIIAEGTLYVADAEGNWKQIRNLSARLHDTQCFLNVENNVRLEFVFPVQEEKTWLRYR